MKRTRKNNNKPADAILTADFHLTESTPVARTDDYLQAQANKLAFLQRLSTQHNNCPVLCAGDIFDKWKASPWLCSWAYQLLPAPLITIPGNHDLPMHNFEYYDKAALALLEKVNSARICILKGDGIDVNKLRIMGVPSGQLASFDPEQAEITNGDGAGGAPARRILLLHELVWAGKAPSWAAGSWKASELIEEFGKHFDLILTGDNHEAFTVEQEGTLLVNPGSMMRITAAQADFQPRGYLYYAGENQVEPVMLPVERGVISREHLDKEQERDERITAYIEQLGSDWEAGLSFRKNLQVFFKEHGTPKKVRDVIWEHLEV